MISEILKVMLELITILRVASPVSTVLARLIFLANDKTLPCDKSLEDCFFQILSYSSAYKRIIYEETEGHILCDRHWENKTCKLKRSILILNLSRRKKKLLNHTQKSAIRSNRAGKRAKNRLTNHNHKIPKQMFSTAHLYFLKFSHRI